MSFCENFHENICENMSETRANAWGSSKKFLFLQKIELFPPNVLRKQKQSGEFHENENSWTISVEVCAKMKLYVKTKFRQNRRIFFSKIS